jgi:hypothetical protein
VLDRASPYRLGKRLAVALGQVPRYTFAGSIFHGYLIWLANHHRKPNCEQTPDIATLAPCVDVGPDADADPPLVGGDPAPSRLGGLFCRSSTSLRPAAPSVAFRRYERSVPRLPDRPSQCRTTGPECSSSGAGNRGSSAAFPCLQPLPLPSDHHRLRARASACVSPPLSSQRKFPGKTGRRWRL